LEGVKISDDYKRRKFKKNSLPRHQSSEETMLKRRRKKPLEKEKEWLHRSGVRTIDSSDLNQRGYAVDKEEK